MNKILYFSFKLLFKDPFFWFYTFCWMLIKISRLSCHPIPYLNNWLTDFVFIPLIAVCSQYFILQFKSKNDKLYYPFWAILLLASWITYIYEFLMPSITSQNIYDTWDIVAYFSGAHFYYFIHQKFVIKNFIKNNWLF